MIRYLIMVSNDSYVVYFILYIDRTFRMLQLHGGKILERCEPETIVVGSSDENYTARALKEFEHYGKVVTCQSLILAVTNMSNSKPWELVNDLTLGGNVVIKINP